MVNVAPLSRDVLEVIARQIGSRLSDAARATLDAGQPLQLTESFPVWVLGLDAVASPELEPTSAARHTGYWHHQIRHGERSVEFARSRPYGPRAEDWRVEEVVESPIAERIDVAVRSVDANAALSGELRLLVVPAYLLHAFWIFAEQESVVVIIDRPESMTALEYDRPLEWRSFLGLLSQYPHAVGVPPNEPRF